MTVQKKVPLFGADWVLKPLEGLKTCSVASLAPDFALRGV